MQPTTPTVPVHRLAIAALVVAGLAGVLALYGSLFAETHLAGSPLNAARQREGLESTRTSPAIRFGLQFVAFVLPLGLGVGAALLGGEAMRAVARSDGRSTGSLSAAFAIMIGGLAAVVAGCMSFAVFAGHLVPGVPTH